MAQFFLSFYSILFDPKANTIAEDRIANYDTWHTRYDTRRLIIKIRGRRRNFHGAQFPGWTLNFELFSPSPSLPLVLIGLSVHGIMPCIWTEYGVWTLFRARVCVCVCVCVFVQTCLPTPPLNAGFSLFPSISYSTRKSFPLSAQTPHFFFFFFDS